MFSTSKSNGHNGDDENDCGSPDEDSDAVDDKRQQLALFVKASERFHRFKFSNSKLGCLFLVWKQKGKIHSRLHSSTWEVFEDGATRQYRFTKRFTLQWRLFIYLLGVVGI